jgi:hypothetical protein
MPTIKTTKTVNHNINWYWPVAAAFSLVFTVFKLSEQITWPWWGVTAPLWAPFAIVAGIFAVIGVLYVLVKLTELLTFAVRMAFSPKYRARRRAMKTLKGAVDRAVRKVITEPSPEMRARINRGREDNVWRF